LSPEKDDLNQHLFKTQDELVGFLVVSGYTTWITSHPRHISTHQPLDSESKIQDSSKDSEIKLQDSSKAPLRKRSEAEESKIKDSWAFAPGAKQLRLGDSESKIKEPWAFAPGAKQLRLGDSESKIKEPWAFAPGAKQLRLGDSEYEEIPLLELGQIEVHPDYQNQGIGSQMMRIMFERYPCSSFCLELGSEDDQLMQFYTKHGFVGFYYCWDDEIYHLIRIYSEDLYTHLKGKSHNTGEKTYGEKTYGEKTYGEKTYGEKTYGEKTYGEKTYGEKTYGEKTYGEKTYGEKTYGEKHLPYQHLRTHLQKNSQPCCDVGILGCVWCSKKKFVSSDSSTLPI
jgi:ribosomal protein S18 acetylase RimI-like enzyme